MKRIIAVLALALCSLVAMAQQQFSSVQILTSATATGAGEVHQPRCSLRTFQANGTTSAGAGSATIVIRGSNLSAPVAATAGHWVDLGTITLTLSTTLSGDGVALFSTWRHVKAHVTAISGTDATVNAYMGC